MNRTEILERANSLITGDRQRDYGNPHENFARVAALWSAYLGCAVTPSQAAVCLCLLKIARLAHQPAHADSAVDACGYLALSQELTTTGDAFVI